MTDDDLRTTITRLRKTKQRKHLLSEGAERFNISPKNGIAFLTSSNLLSQTPTPTDIVTFLMTTPSLSKRLIGEYLASPKHVELLGVFMTRFRFEGRRVDEGLRLLLESFRLPGEAQQIDRIMETFSKAYFQANDGRGDGVLGVPKNADSVYVLSFAIIMLNTDHHNSQIKHKMTLEGFVRNLRGTNDGENFPEEYLTSIYEAITTNEIVMPEEQEGDLAFDYKWREMLTKVTSQPQGNSMTTAKGIHPKLAVALYHDMIAEVYHYILDALHTAFDLCETEVIMNRLYTAIRHCAALTTLYQQLPSSTSDSHASIDDAPSTTSSITTTPGMEPLRYPDILDLDPIIEAMCGFTALLKSLPSRDTLYEYVAMNPKAKMALSALVHMSSTYGNMIREGWNEIVRVVRALYMHNLLPESMLMIEDFIHGSVKLSLRPVPRGTRKDTTGLFNTLTHYLNLAQFGDDEEHYPSEWEDEARKTIDAVKMKDIFSESRFLEEASLDCLINALLHASEDALKYNESGQIEHSRDKNTPAPFLDLATLFLDMAVKVTMQNRDRIGFLWPVMYHYLKEMLSLPACNFKIIQHSVVSLLLLCARLSHKDDMIEDVNEAIGTLLELKEEVFDKVAAQIMAGISRLVQQNSSFIQSEENYRNIVALITRTCQHPNASSFAFNVLDYIMNESVFGQLKGDTFGECVDLLIGFIAAASSSPTSVENDVLRGASPKFPTKRSSDKQFDSIERGAKALDKLFRLHTRISSIIQGDSLSPEVAWSTYWLPVFSGLSQQCYHPCRDIRQLALTLLQRSFLLPELVQLDRAQWVDCFDLVLFPLLGELLKPEVYQLDPHGMGETRMRAAGLLAKLFLQNLGKIHEWPSLPDLWLHILTFLQQYLRTNSDGLTEAVRESLKNMLLVMSSTADMFSNATYTFGNNPRSFSELKQSSAASLDVNGSINFWELTWTKISSFDPNLRKELFPVEEFPVTNPPKSDVSNSEEETLANENGTLR